MDFARIHDLIICCCDFLWLFLTLFGIGAILVFFRVFEADLWRID